MKTRNFRFADFGFPGFCVATGLSVALVSLTGCGGKYCWRLIEIRGAMPRCCNCAVPTAAPSQPAQASHTDSPAQSILAPDSHPPAGNIAPPTPPAVTPEKPKDPVPPDGVPSSRKILDPSTPTGSTEISVLRGKDKFLGLADPELIARLSMPVGNRTGKSSGSAARNTEPPANHPGSESTPENPKEDAETPEPAQSHVPPPALSSELPSQTVQASSAPQSSAEDAVARIGVAPGPGESPRIVLRAVAPDSLFRKAHSIQETVAQVPVPSSTSQPAVIGSPHVPTLAAVFSAVPPLPSAPQRSFRPLPPQPESVSSTPNPGFRDPEPRIFKALPNSFSEAQTASSSQSGSAPAASSASLNENSNR